MSKRREMAEKLFNELAGKKAARQQLDDEIGKIEARLDQLMPDDEMTLSLFRARPQSPVPKGQQQPGSLGARLLDRINREPTRSFSAEDLKDLANGSHMQTLRAGLFRLLKAGSIERPKRGHFRATKAVREAAKAVPATGSAA